MQQFRLRLQLWIPNYTKNSRWWQITSETFHKSTKHSSRLKILVDTISIPHRIKCSRRAFLRSVIKASSWPQKLFDFSEPRGELAILCRKSPPYRILSGRSRRSIRFLPSLRYSINAQINLHTLIAVCEQPKRPAIPDEEAARARGGTPGGIHARRKSSSVDSSWTVSSTTVRRVAFRWRTPTSLWPVYAGIKFVQEGQLPRRLTPMNKRDLPLGYGQS